MAISTNKTSKTLQLNLHTGNIINGQIIPCMHARIKYLS